MRQLRAASDRQEPRVLVALQRLSGGCLSWSLHTGTSFVRLSVAKAQHRTAPCHAQLDMPSAAKQALKQDGFLFLERRSTGTQYNISAMLNVKSMRSPFRMNCTLPVRGSEYALRDAMRIIALWQVQS